jgi:hypothetical protein
MWRNQMSEMWGFIIVGILILIGFLLFVDHLIDSRVKNTTLTVDITPVTEGLKDIQTSLDAITMNLYRIWDDGLYLREKRPYISENRKAVAFGKDIPNTYTTEDELNSLIDDKIRQPFEGTMKEAFENRYQEMMSNFEKISHKVRPIIVKAATDAGYFDDNGLSMLPDEFQRIDEDVLLLSSSEFSEYVESNLTDFSVDNRDAIDRWFDIEATTVFYTEEEQSLARQFFFKGYYACSDELTESIMGGPDEPNFL